jgi:uncharacterized protein YprB with RNaseH-like and TPR domain
MLENTFIHILGIGPKTEQAIWRKGIRTWKDFLSSKEIVISTRRDPLVRIQLEDSIINRSNVSFFADRLSANDHWRIFNGFRERAAYLDIETSGMYPGADEITVIGIYDGYNVYTFVSGRNMSEFEQAIASYDIVITFNGSSFDLPFIRESFPGISLPPAHIDLRFLLRRLGYRGGLKYIEKRFGISRDQEIDGMGGYDAVRLWQAYQWGDENALDLLIRYNTADIVNLKPLMEKGHDMTKERLVSFPA